MNKKEVNELLPLAYDSIAKCGIATEDGKIDSKFRGYISSYGAAITMGSLLSATAFFSAKGSAKEDRYKLMDAIYYIIKKAELPAGSIEHNTLFKYIRDEEKGGHSKQVYNDVINSAIAIKLAMNLYDLGKDNSKEKENES